MKGCVASKTRTKKDLSPVSEEEDCESENQSSDSSYEVVLKRKEKRRPQPKPRGRCLGSPNLARPTTPDFNVTWVQLRNESSQAQGLQLETS